MKVISANVTLILTICLLLTPSTKAQIIADWQLLELEPQKLSQLLEALHSAEEQVLEFEFIPYRTEGRLEGCGYEYRIFMNDNAGPSSHPFVAHGAIAYFSPEEGDAHLSFKIGLKYIKEHNSRIWDRIGAVHYAYLRFGNRSLAGKEYATASAAEDVRIFRYRDSQEAGLMNWLTLPETLSIHINRERSGVDLQFDLSVLDHRDAWMDLGACYRELQRIRR